MSLRDTFDNYIDNLRKELTESITEIKEIPQLTYEMFEHFDKVKCFKNLYKPDAIKPYLIYSNKNDCEVYSITPAFIQIKFKEDIVSFDKLFNICVGDYPFINIRVLIINALLNKSCIINGCDFYYRNTFPSCFPIREFEIDNECDSIIEDIWCYNIPISDKKSEPITFRFKYLIFDASLQHKYPIKKSTGIVLNLTKINQYVLDVSYIIFNYSIQIDSCSYNKNIKIVIDSKYKLNVIGNYYWIKNIFTSDELYNEKYSFSDVDFILYSDLDEYIDSYYSTDNYLTEFYFIYNLNE